MLKYVNFLESTMMKYDNLLANTMLKYINSLVNTMLKYVKLLGFQYHAKKHQFTTIPILCKPLHSLNSVHF